MNQNANFPGLDMNKIKYKNSWDFDICNPWRCNFEIFYLTNNHWFSTKLAQALSHCSFIKKHCFTNLRPLFTVKYKNKWNWDIGITINIKMKFLPIKHFIIMGTLNLSMEFIKRYSSISQHVQSSSKKSQEEKKQRRRGTCECRRTGEKTMTIAIIFLWRRLIFFRLQNISVIEVYLDFVY